MSGVQATREMLLDLKKAQLDQLAAYRKQKFIEPELRHLFLELTLQCNARCFHCGSSCDPNAPQGLAPEQYLAVLEDVKENFDLSRMMLCITGGEPLLYKDFFPLMQEAHRMGFSWGMTSNATFITRDVARKLREAGMGTISVSIDGLPETHDRLRGLPGGWKRAMQGIQNLIDEGGFRAIQVTTVLNHQNMQELDRLYEIFEKVDLDSWRVVGLEPIGRAKEHPDLMLTPEDQRRMFDFIREKREADIPVQYGCSHFLGLDYEREVRDWYFFCNAGVYTASIMANGDIGACLDIERRPETVQGSVLREKFSDVWRNRFELFRKPLSTLNRTCAECPEEKWCGGGAAHSWDYDRNEQQICFRNILWKN